MSKVTLILDTDNADFGPDGEAVASLLAGAAKAVLANGLHEDLTLPLRDANGNTVGTLVADAVERGEE